MATWHHGVQLMKDGRFHLLSFFGSTIASGLRYFISPCKETQDGMA